MTEAIREELHELADEAYREFNRSLVPGEILPMIGVRMPVLRAFAKRLSRESFYSYLETAPEYYEELLLQGLIIGYARMSNEERCRWLDKFVPKIDNWAVCDSCCVTYRFMEKDQELSLIHI